jgi:hypothetical protein
MQEELTPQSGGLTPIRLPTLSRTGGPRPTEPPPSSGTGMQPSERGAVATPLGRWVLQQLALFTLPEGTMRSMSSLLLSRLETVRAVDVTAADGQFEYSKAGPIYPPTGMTRHQLGGDLEVLDAACKPCRPAEIGPIVAKLKARTISRNAGEGEDRFQAEVLLDDLAKYPLDVVEWACEYWVGGGAQSKWMPSWPELKELCDRRMDGRLRLRRAVEYAWNEAA